VVMLNVLVNTDIYNEPILQFYYKLVCQFAASKLKEDPKRRPLTFFNCTQILGSG
jgi:hypothetical protein